MTRLVRGLLVALVICAGSLLVPETATAHIANYNYKFPLPLWVFLTGGALAVLASAPAAAFAVSDRRDWTTRSFYGWFASLRLGAIFTALATLLFVDAMVGGVFGQDDFAENPLGLLVWVDFWVGLGVVCSLVGNVWDFVSPLNAAGRALERVIPRDVIPARAYPRWLGVWPSVALLLAWSWTELVWTQGDRPRVIASILILYFVAQLFGMAIYGAEVWLARAELFTVLARTFARFAPLEFYVQGFECSCRALRCRPEDAERIGCPACWLQAPRHQRGLRLRAYGAGVRREPGLGAGGGALVVALLATVVYDGFRGTNAYLSFQDAINWRAHTYESLGSASAPARWRLVPDRRATLRNSGTQPSRGFRASSLSGLFRTRARSGRTARIDPLPMLDVLIRGAWEAVASRAQFGDRDRRRILSCYGEGCGRR